MALKETADGDTFRILLATDVHLGCFENDEIRGEDSFRAFDEIMQLAVDKKVDFVLLGGDLFHENKPSRQCIYKACKILKKYCLGNQEMSFDIVSDQSINFPETRCVNYENPNFNISLPVFTIHGNHDDPYGTGHYSALDILSVCNLVNYFGKSKDANDIQIHPILFKKGVTSLALYGLGAISDEILHRTFQTKKVKWIRPLINKGDWFNMFVIHQNRTRHSQQLNNCIKEEMLPRFLDVVMWGHEHECILDLEESLTGNFFITQPGSSVHTSLCQGESVKKHVGVMEIRGDQCRIVPVALKSVRNFLMKDIVLDDHLEQDVDQVDVEEFLIAQVEHLIKTAEEEYSDVHSHESKESHPTDINTAKIPLIRLRVDHTGFERINSHRFGQNFIGKVANPDDIIKYLKKRAPPSRTGKGHSSAVEQLHQPREDVRINDLVRSHLDVDKPLTILVEQDLTSALSAFVEKQETRAVEEFVDDCLADIQQHLDEEQNCSNIADISELVGRRTQERRNYHNDKMFTEEVEKRKDIENESLRDISPKTEQIMEVDNVQVEEKQGYASPKRELRTFRSSSDSNSRSQALESQSSPSRTIRSPGGRGVDSFLGSSARKVKPKRSKVQQVDLAFDSDENTNSNASRKKRKIAPSSGGQSQYSTRNQHGSQMVSTPRRQTGEMKQHWGGARKKRK